MKTKTTFVILAATLLLCGSPNLRGQVPSMLTYQGRLQASGTNFTGTGQFKFALVDAGSNTVRSATATATVNAGVIAGILVTDGGSGYSSAPSVTITDPTGTGATAVAVVSGGAVVAVNPVSNGSGYSGSPTVTIAPPPPQPVYETYWSNDGSSSAGGEPASATGVPVSEGLFTVGLGDTNLPNMGALPTSAFLHEGVALRIWFSDGSGGFQLLSPDQRLTSAGYALVAESLEGPLPSAGLSGSYSNAITFQNAANSFSGSGAGLTSLNASRLSSGTVPDARLAANVARTSQVWLLGGNAGTKPGADFLGTTDDQPLELRINGLRAFRLEPTGDGSDSFTIPDGAPNVVGGSPWNAAAAGIVGATISGGGATNYAGHAYTNAVLADYGTIGGGVGNRIGAGSVAGTVGGGFLNDIGHNSPRGAIAGGDNNRIADNSYGGTIAGGLGNHIGTNSYYGAIAGGYNNDILNNAGYATIPGGLNNTATNYAFAAGRRAKALHEGAFVWADSVNADFASTAKQQFLIRAGGGVGINKSDPATALDVNGTVTATAFSGSADGSPLVLRAADQTVLRLEGEASGTRIIGGRGNVLDSGSTNSAILSGRDNTITNAAHESVIVGGAYNKIRTDQRSAFIGGGARNEIRQDNQHAVIVGGCDNRIGTNSLYTSILGGSENRFGGKIKGGLIVGGFRNDILGGLEPSRHQIAPLIVGGSDNEIGESSDWAAILSGERNRIGTNCDFSLICGGVNNSIGDNDYTTDLYRVSDNFIGGGGENDIGDRCRFSVIAGGNNNEVLDDSRYATIPGGYWNEATNLSFAAGYGAKAHHTGTFVWADSSDVAFPSTAPNQFNVRATGGVRIVTGINAAGVPDAGVSLNANDTSWNVISDRAAKKNFRSVDTREILERLAQLPVQHWNYQWEADGAVPHLGPVAQDFKAAFYPGRDDKTISTLETDGVALAAIQGLNQKLENRSQESEVRSQKLEAKNAALEKQVAELKALVESLAEKVSGGEQ
jgi:hypothetical protein